MNKIIILIYSIGFGISGLLAAVAYIVTKNQHFVTLTGINLILVFQLYILIVLNKTREKDE